MTDTPTNIAFIARACGGKTTASEYLVDARGFGHVGFAEPLRALQPLHESSPSDWRELIRHWVYEFRIPDVLSMQETAHLENGILNAFSAYPTTPGTKNRPLLQNIGTHVGRGLDDFLWIKLLLARAEAVGGAVTLDDCRFDNEARALKQNDWVLSYIWASEPTLDKRYTELYGAPMTPEQKAHISESGIPALRPLCHYVIHNDDDDLNTLYNEVDWLADTAHLIRSVAV
jgi:hypothetical protein